MPRPPLHPLYEAALAAMDPSFREWNPEGRSPSTWTLPHLGGPQPMVPRPAQTEIVFWCAERVLPFVQHRRDSFAGAIRDARALPRDVTPEARRVVVESLDGVARTLEGEQLGWIARLVGFVAGRPSTASRNVVRTARVAVMRTMRVLVSNRRKTFAPEEFLDELDDKLMRAELAACVRRRSADAATRLDALVYRGGDAKGDTVVWVARLAPRSPDAAWGGLVRNSGFHWGEGTASDALAIVPDDHFERATAAVFGA